MAVVTMRQLLESGVHFGHQTRRWNPKMKRFIMTERNGIYIIDLQQSLAYIDRSYAFIKDTVAKGGTIMFVGTKKQAQEAIAEQATRVGMPYVNQRWLGGMLTNFQTVHQRINRLKELDEIDFEDVAGSSRTKKELLHMRRERDKLNKSLGGIREMSRTPSAVWIVDTNKEHLAVEEARKLHIPIIGILDSNCDPDLVDFPIPGNDDAIRAVGLLTRVVADAVAEGLIARSGVKTEAGGEAPVGAEEPLAEWERELLGGDAEKAAVTATGGDADAEAPAAEATGASSEAAEATEVAAEATETPLEEPVATNAVITEATETPAPEAEVVDTPAAEVVETPAAEVVETPAAEVTETPAEVADEAPAAGETTTEGDELGADSAAALEDGSAPEGFEIKGNKNSMKFHAPSSPWYGRTIAEVWFRTAEAAEAAGYANAESTDGETVEA
jgi:small subunit ribosomal protein S2